MSVGAGRAQKILLARLAAADVGFLALHLDLPTPLPEAAGVDAFGRSVLLIPSPALMKDPQASDVTQLVLDHLADGHVPDGVVSIGFQPQASQAGATVLYRPGIDEALIDGGRRSGKTVLLLALLGALAHAHAQAGEPLPFKVLALHATLRAAAQKTVESMLEPLWRGLWSIRDNLTLGVLTLGGIELVHVHFVPGDPASGGEGARAAADALWLEEGVPSLDEVGVAANLYELARSSLGRRPTPRPIALVSTNPGSPTHWIYERFISQPTPTRARCQVLPADRLSQAEDAAQIAGFTDLDLQRRLGLSEWTATTRGATLLPGFNEATHVAPGALTLTPYGDLTLGWDSAVGAHTHCTVIGERVNRRVHLVACLVSEGTGLDQHLRDVVLPWFQRHAPWVLTPQAKSAGCLVHWVDPSMTVKDGGNYEMSPELRVRRALGGVVREGETEWGKRLGPMVDLLARGDGTGRQAVQVARTADTELLLRALAGEAYYEILRDGRTARDKMYKPNHPWEDCIDALLYWAGGIAPQLDRLARAGSRPPIRTKTTYDVLGRDRR